MSVHVSSCVWKHADAKGNDLLVLLALADTANDDGVCWPGNEYVADKTRLSKRTVIRAIDRLEVDGQLVTTQRPGTSNLCQIVVCEGCQVVTPRGDRRARRGDTGDTPGVTQVTPEPSMNHQETSGGGSRRKPETTIPDEWKPSTRHEAFATQHGLDLSSEAFSFRAHALANDRRMRDWDAAFAMWLSKARQFARQQQPQPRSQWDRAVRVRSDEA